MHENKFGWGMTEAKRLRLPALVEDVIFGYGDSTFHTKNHLVISTAIDTSCGHVSSLPLAYALDHISNPYNINSSYSYSHSYSYSYAISTDYLRYQAKYRP